MSRRARDAAIGPVELAILQRLIPYARKIAWTFCRRLPSNIAREDIFAAAVTGAWQTALRHGDCSDEELIAQAGLRIRGEIVDELRRQDWLPRKMRSRIAKGIATPLRVMYADDVGYHELSRATVSAAPRPDQITEHRQSGPATAERIAGAFRYLKDRDAWIVALHYRGGMRFRDIGELFGVSEPRISQLHARAIARLQRLLEDPS